MVTAQEETGELRDVSKLRSAKVVLRDMTKLLSGTCDLATNTEVIFLYSVVL